MRFGIILLILIAICSVIGSVIQQGQNVSYYAQNYGTLHGIILILGLNNIFKQWYFALLLILLCINLTLCSIVRISAVIKGDKNASLSAANAPDTVYLTSAGIKKLEEYLRNIKCKEETSGSAKVFSRGSIGRYGTFITHVAILLTVIFGALALYLPNTVDKTCFPGESITAQDGSVISVETFRIEDETGSLDFTSTIQVTSPSGKQSGIREISVNHPLSFGNLKIYQQTYGTAGSVTVTDLETGAQDDFILNEVSFLSADGLNGLWYQTVYPGYIKDEDGTMTLITSTSGSYTDPVYEFQTLSDGEFTPVLAFPGESVQVMGLEFTFNNPVEYPGLRIKYTPTIVNVLLIISFLLMIAGLYITFFMPVILVKTDSEGYAVCGPKSEKIRLDLKTLLHGYEIEKEE